MASFTWSYFCMNDADFEEIEFLIFARTLTSRNETHENTTFENCFLCDPQGIEEFPIKDFGQNKISFVAADQTIREGPLTAFSNWTVLVPRNHHMIVETSKNDPHQLKRQIIANLRSQNIPVNFEQELDDLKLIARCASISLKGTTKDMRLRLYAIIKKLENFAQFQTDSFRIGRKIIEGWASETETSQPADLLIHLAYYRRWTKDTRLALVVTECLEGKKFNFELSDKERSILATERAAAFLDLYEQEKTGLSDALRFLKYSQAANKGINSPENQLCWMRYNKLTN